MHIPELRSPHDKVGGVVYFGRMLDKIRLNAAGKLPAEYLANLGEGFDLRCLTFLGVSYAALTERTLQGGTDEALLEWCFLSGHRPGEEQVDVWNEFMRKRGWNDALSERLQQRLAEGGFLDRKDVQTFFDYIDLDEGRR